MNCVYELACDNYKTCIVKIKISDLLKQEDVCSDFCEDCGKWGSDYCADFEHYIRCSSGIHLCEHTSIAEG